MPCAASGVPGICARWIPLRSAVRRFSSGNGWLPSSRKATARRYRMRIEEKNASSSLEESQAGPPRPIPAVLNREISNAKRRMEGHKAAISASSDQYTSPSKKRASQTLQIPAVNSTARLEIPPPPGKGKNWACFMHGCMMMSLPLAWKDPGADSKQPPESSPTILTRSKVAEASWILVRSGM